MNFEGRPYQFLQRRKKFRIFTHSTKRRFAMATTGPQGSSQHASEQGRRGQATGHRSQTEASGAGNIVSAVTEKLQDAASGAKETVEEWGSAAAGAAGQARHKAQD